MRAAALGVDSFRHLAPSVDLRVDGTAGRVGIALGPGQDLGGRGDDQAGGRPLAIVLSRERSPDQGGTRAIAVSGAIALRLFRSPSATVTRSKSAVAQREA